MPGLQDCHGDSGMLKPGIVVTLDGKEYRRRFDWDEEAWPFIVDVILDNAEVEGDARKAAEKEMLDCLRDGHFTNIDLDEMAVAFIRVRNAASQELTGVMPI
jgi:hypothetical protein